MTERRTKSAGRCRADQGGFTLVELLVVVVILGILAATVVLAVGNSGTNAAVAACQADAKTVETALEEYKSQNLGSYPPGPASPTDTTNSTTGWGALLIRSNGTAFLREEPATTHYVIWWDSSGNVYVASAGSSYPATSSSENFDLTNGSACSTYAHSARPG